MPGFVRGGGQLLLEAGWGFCGQREMESDFGIHVREPIDLWERNREHGYLPYVDYLMPGEELVIEPFNRMIQKKQLVAVPYDGFWRSMDTFKDKMQLDELLTHGRGPWQVWQRS